MERESAPPVSVRKAVRADAESIARLHHLVRRISMPYVPELHTIDETVLYFTNVITGQTVLVAGRESIIGYCAFRNEWLDHLYVHPTRQRQGVGTRLLREAMAESEALKLWVFQKNVAATRFYERHGFTRIRATDGTDNEEREPDALYAWRRRGVAP